MANLDTALKRLSGINVGSPWRGQWPLPDGVTTGTDRNVGVYFYSGISGAAFVPTISVTLTDASNNALASLSGLYWSWWDSVVFASQGSRTLGGTGATTDIAGVFSVTTLPGSTLTAGQTGWIEISDSDGTPANNATGRIAGGPVTVS